MSRTDTEQLAKDLAERLEKEQRVLTKVRDRNSLRLDRWDTIEESLDEEVLNGPLSIEKIVTYRITYGTGGPACGVDIDQLGNGKAWGQDWFTPKAYVDLDAETAQFLVETFLTMDFDEE